ncbi:MAG: hypothetical protein Q9M09_01630 [Mariprofundaceae bacterium]|nr:hypothetical protein [Mariprofundaceae bacterium]
MASFIGTVDEFTKFISPRARNVVNTTTKKYKAEIGQCQHCGSNDRELDAAHVTGRERLKIIENILRGFTNGEIVTIDLEVFENLFLSEHLPISENILVLCRLCHRKYDAIENNEAEINEDSTYKLISNSEITAYLRKVIPDLLDEEIINLQSLDYCKLTFGLNFEVLKNIPLNSNLQQIRQLAQINGYNRWSTQRSIEAKNHRYLVCTQWVDKHRHPFLVWQKKIENGHSSYSTKSS